MSILFWVAMSILFWVAMSILWTVFVFTVTLCVVVDLVSIL